MMDESEIAFEDLGESVSSDDSLTCELCGKSVNTSRGLKIHMARVHDISSAKADGTPKSLRGKPTNLEKELTEFFMMIAMVVTMVNPTDGTIIGANASRNAVAWSHLAQQNKAVRSFLTKLMTTSAFGEVVMAGVFTAIPILANHQKVPPELAGLFAGFAPDHPHAEN